MNVDDLLNPQKEVKPSNKHRAGFHPEHGRIVCKDCDLAWTAYGWPLGESACKVTKKA